MKIQKVKILVIVGPTATGKSDLAILLAKKLNGEVISADSRQVYTGMDIGTGKVTEKEMQGLPHHLLDVSPPKKIFTVADYKRMATKIIEEVLKRNKLPIICGGTGLYIQSIVDGLVLPEVPPNLKLRKHLKKISTEELFQELKKLDPRRARNIDSKNRVRLIRAIEITKVLGTVPKLKLEKNKKYEFLQIGLNLNKEELKSKIEKRLTKRIRAGMISEVKRLRESNVSWQRLYDFGLEYRFVADYLQSKITKKAMGERLTAAINQYAKRQMTWFKRDKRIKWFRPEETEKIDREIIDWIRPS